MKKRRTLALLMAGILTASALSIGASAEDTEPAPQAGIEQEETVSEKKAKKSADSSSESGTAKRKPGKKGSKTVEPEGVIGKEAAKEAALTDAGVEAEGRVRGRYTEKDGTGIYKVTFKAGGQKYKYRIDAMTGEILEKSVTEITE